ncbi:MAG: imidazole glycerol phosphate synthase subunit HisH [Anaerolineaceae bacterium]|nr:imidazole glycerol phosphate synthase subunit HisH [Anaerolineaceae bacterium]MDE0329868.1 imidazole glycerol phosphate synthase subunit HisH [Anaerolineaceae bacterium]
MLAVIDYGAGNLRSVVHALRALGVRDMQVVQDGAGLRSASRIILPGVGAFGAGMQQLGEKKFIDPLVAAIINGVPCLGICLGMQFLFERSDEMGQHDGLGLLPGHVTRFPPHATLKVPHMGWNALTRRQASPLLARVRSDSQVYFVHSYCCMPDCEEDVIASTDYGVEFASAVQRGVLFGVQFHPEKSQQVGLQMLRNFLEWAP